MTKYDDLPVLIKTLYNINKQESDKFKELTTELISKDEEIRRLDNELIKLNRTIESNKRNIVTYSAAAAVGGYIIGK